MSKRILTPRQRCLLFILCLIVFQTLSFVLYFTYHLKYTDIDLTTTKHVIHFNDNIPAVNPFQSTLNDYVEFIAKFNYEDNNMKQNMKVRINGVLFETMSKELIINALSNKVIVLFGDSLTYYLTSYIIHVIQFCVDGKINKCKCKHFCDHLENENTSLILGECEENILNHREYLVNKVLYDIDFDGYHTNNLSQNSKSIIYFRKHNITIHLYYKWAENIKNINQLMDDTLKYETSNYNIMINNFLNTHFTIFRKESFLQMWNYNVSISMLSNMEYYLEKIIQANRKKCLIFGPVNPWFANYKELILWLKKVLIPLLFDKKCKYFMDTCMANNINYDNIKINDTNLWIKLSQIISSPNILQCIDPIINNTSNAYEWKDHLNYLWLNMDKNWHNNFSQRVHWCAKGIMPKHMINKDNKKKHQNMANNVCLLYHQGLGQTLIAERIKQYITNLDTTTNRVYYHDQYMLYHSFNKLAQYRVHSIHYPRLLPIAFNNILQIILNGC